MKYVMADIHGEYDKLVRMLRLIKFSKSDTIYILGDLMDRGNKPLEVLKLIWDNSNIHVCLGNHDEIMVMFYKNPDNYRIGSFWADVGGTTTYDMMRKQSKSMQLDIINYMELLPLYFVDNNFVMCHAGIRMEQQYVGKDVYEIMGAQSKDNLLNIRSEYYTNRAIPDKLMITGHTTTKHIRRYVNEPEGNIMKIWYDKKYDDKIGIDCGCCFDDGQLACIRLDDMKEFYVR